LAGYKRVKAKLGETAPDLFEGLSYRSNQFELVGLVGKYPEIDVVAAVLGGEGTETGKSLDTFRKLATSFNIVAPVFEIFCLRFHFSTNVCASLLFHLRLSIHPRSCGRQVIIAAPSLTIVALAAIN
jgi:hypothetical protein